MNHADNQMAYELGLNAGHQGLESMKLALRSVPLELTTQATSVAIAFIRHRLTVLVAEITAKLPADGIIFSDIIDEVEKHFDTIALELVQKGQQGNA